MAAETSNETREILAIRRADGESRTLAASLPRLVLEARRIAANVIHGLHGRRRAGAGESFWQYRRFVSGEPSQNVDWRRSARDDHLYVREQEWEAAHTVWLWPDRSPSMAFASQQARDSKLERALIVTFALAELLVAGGERVGIPGLMNPTASRSVIDKMAQAMLHDDAARPSLPPSFVPSALAEIVVLSDFWSPIGEIRSMLAGLSASGAHGTLLQIVDPAEETFPYSGRVEFVEPEGGDVIVAGRAEKWAGDYVASVALHRDQIRSETGKLDRALVVSFALAEVLVQGGERVGIPEILRPTANRNIIEKMAQAIVHDAGNRPSVPPNFSPAAFSEVLLLSDFWSPISEFRHILGQLAASGARGHVVQVVDPAEESFPYAGRIEFIESEGLCSVTAGRARRTRPIGRGYGGTR